MRTCTCLHRCPGWRKFMLEEFTKSNIFELIKSIERIDDLLYFSLAIDHLHYILNDRGMNWLARQFLIPSCVIPWINSPVIIYDLAPNQVWDHMDNVVRRVIFATYKIKEGFQFPVWQLNVFKIKTDLRLCLLLVNSYMLWSRTVVSDDCKVFIQLTAHVQTMPIASALPCWLNVISKL